MKYVIALIGLLSIIFVAGCITGVNETNRTNATTGTGRAVFTITDATADLNTVSKVEVTIESVRIHSPTRGWITISSSPRTYDLLQLGAENRNALLVDAQVAADTYNQIRLDISSVIVSDAQGTHQAKLPSGEVRMPAIMQISQGSTTAASFDFLVNESLHVTGRGGVNATGNVTGRTKYILAPVIHAETRENASIQTSANNRVDINGGNVRSSLTIGMDISGNVAPGFRIPPNAIIDVGADGTISIGNATISGIGSIIGNASIISENVEGTVTSNTTGNASSSAGSSGGGY